MTDNEKMREVWDAHDKARNKAWREEPGTFDTLDAFKAGAAWQAAKSVPVVGEVLFFASDSTATSQSQIRCDVCADQKDYSFFPVVRKPTHSITEAELDLIRQWIDCVQDVNKVFLNKQDFILAKKIYEIVGMRVPNSILTAAIAGEKK